MESTPSSHLERGTAALAAGDWTSARAAFGQALEAEESPEAFEGYAIAQWGLNQATEACRAREAAYRLYLERGDQRGAARAAVDLSRDHADYRGEMAVGNGWLQRARRLLEDLPEGPEHAWLRFREGEVALIFGGLDVDAALAAGSDAAAIGRRVGSLDAEMIGIALEGLALVMSGRVDEGMGRLDEASAAVVSGEGVGIGAAVESCCLMLFACEAVRDFDRAAQWCEKLREVAERVAMRSLFAICRAHYAAVLISRGEWAAAEAELEAATRDLGETYPGMLPEGLVRYGELRRRQGRLDEAEALFRRAEGHPHARIGLGRVALDRGRPQAAVEGLSSVLRQVSSTDKTTRSAALESLVEACVAADRVEEARRAATELEEAAGVLGTPPLHAAARRAQGLVAEAEGDHGAARQAFQDAVHLLAGSEMPFETARARLDLARALDREGLRPEAGREATSARELFGAMGAAHMVERVESTIPLFDGSPRSSDPGASAAGADGTPPASPLTGRETEVLRLVAEGLTNREVAERLFLSEHTVHRHLANIFRKLGTSSRAAAVASASRSGLL